MDDKHLRIAFFTDNYLPQLNGISICVQNLAESFRKQGHSVLIFAPSIPKHHDKSPHVIRFPAIQIDRPTNYIGIPFSPKAIQSFLDFKPDIIHSHTFTTVGFSGYLLSKFKKTPFFFSQHTAFFHDDYLYRLKSLGSPKLAKNTLQSYSSFTCNLADHVIAPSQKIYNYLREQKVTKPINVIPNGINLTPFQTPSTPNKIPAHLRLPKTGENLITVGRLDPEKRTGSLIGLMPSLIELRPRAHLYIVGEGMEKPDLRKQVNKLRLQKHVSFLGEVPHHLLPVLLHSSQIFLTASVSEVHPVTIIEALASGLPVIAPKDQAYSKMVFTNRNGYLIPRLDSQFVKKIDYLLNHSDVRADFSRQSLQISNDFSIEKQTKKLLRLYLDAIAKLII